MSPVRLVLGLPGSGSTLSPFVVASMVIHVVFAIALVAFPGFGRTEALPEDILVVDVVASLPAGPPPSPAKTTTSIPAQPEPEPEAARVEPQDVEPPEPEKDEPVKAPEPEKPEPSAATGPSETPATPSTTPGAGTEGSGVVGVDLGALGHAWYRDSVAAALRRHWVRPVLEAREVLEITVSFEILRDGTVRNVRIAAPSGVPSLDRSALRAVVDASPLPPLPTSWRDPSVSAEFLFRWLPGED